MSIVNGVVVGVWTGMGVRWLCDRQDAKQWKRTGTTYGWNGYRTSSERTIFRLPRDFFSRILAEWFLWFLDSLSNPALAVCTLRTYIIPFLAVGFPLRLYPKTDKFQRSSSRRLFPHRHISDHVPSNVIWLPMYRLPNSLEASDQLVILRRHFDDSHSPRYSSMEYARYRYRKR